MVLWDYPDRYLQNILIIVYSVRLRWIMNKLKIAIIGAGTAGLSCALECEKLGVTAEVFERHHAVGWIWPSVSSWLDIFSRRYGSDPIKYIKDTYDINIKSALG